MSDALPTPIVSVAFTGTDDSPTWTQLANVLSITTNRGRSREIDQFNAGTCTITLQNTDRRYDPENTAGPYYGNLLPMRPIKIEAQFNSVTYTVFRGYVDAWPQTYDVGNTYADVALTATDGFKKLERKIIDTPYGQQVLTDSPTRWWTLSDATGTTATDRMRGGDGTYIGSPTLGATGIVPGDSGTAVTFNGDKQYVSFANKAVALHDTELWFTMPTVGTTDQVILAGGTQPGVSVDTVWSLRVGGSSGGNAGKLFVSAFSSSAASTSRVDSGKLHQVVMQFSTNSLYLDGQLVGTYGLNFGWPIQSIGTYLNSSAATLSFIGTIQDVIVYGANLTAAQIATHYNAGTSAFAGETSGVRVGRILDWAGWPTTLRAVDNGDVTIQAEPTDVGGTSALDALHTIDNTEEGAFYIAANGTLTFRSRSGPITASRSLVSQATFGDTTGELPYTALAFDFDDTLLRNYVTGQRAGGVAQTAQDATSIATYGTMSYQRPTTLETSDTEVAGAVARQVVFYKDVKTRVSAMTVDGRATANGKTPADIFPVILQREIGDRMTVRRRPQGTGAMISKDVMIEGIAHTSQPGSWVVTFQLSALPWIGTMWLILDDTTYGKLGTGILL